ncbi:MAG: FecR family protein [Burkholderiales bacterium]|nr:FecR family protein [Burkholderiales bacterium]
MGRVLVAVGEAEVERAGTRIALARGSTIEQGDTVRVGPASNVQIRFADGAILSLRERSILRVDEYVWRGAADGSERSFLTLVAGGMRKIAGAIGKLRRDDRYGVRTATASIGIRGTHFVLRECNDLSPCTVGGRAGLLLAQAPRMSDAPLIAQAAASPAPSGTYGGVSDGRIGVVNEGGDAEFGAGEFFHVPDRTSPPQRLLSPPRFLFDRLEGQQRRTGQRGEETGETVAGGIDSEGRQNEVPPPPRESAFMSTETRTSAGSSAVVPAEGAITHALVGAFSSETVGGFLRSQDFTTVVVGPNTKLSSFQILAGNNAVPGGGTSATSGLAGPITAMFNDTTANAIGAIWGRWEEGTVAIGSSSFNIGPNNHFHYLLGPIAPPEVVNAKSGTFSLSLVGGTPPTNEQGALGSFSLSSAGVDFTAKTVSFSGLAMVFGYPYPSQTWSFLGPITAPIQFGKGAFFSASAAGSCSGPGCNSTSATLNMRGVFMGAAGDHVGVGMHAFAGTSHASTVQLFKH